MSQLDKTKLINKICNIVDSDNTQDIRKNIGNNKIIDDLINNICNMVTSDRNSEIKKVMNDLLEQNIFDNNIINVQLLLTLGARTRLKYIYDIPKNTDMMNILIKKDLLEYSCYNAVLEYCAKQGDLNLVKIIFEEIDVNSSQKFLTLSESINNNHYDIAYYLLSNKWYNMKSNNDLLIRTVRFGYTDICKLLIDFGADIHIGQPLIVSVINGYIEIVKLLLDAGADIHVDDDNALRMSIKYNRKEILELLLSKGANKKVIDKYEIKITNKDILMILDDDILPELINPYEQLYEENITLKKQLADIKTIVFA